MCCKIWGVGGRCKQKSGSKGGVGADNSLRLGPYVAGSRLGGFTYLKNKGILSKVSGFEDKSSQSLSLECSCFWGICGFVEVLTSKCLRQGKELYIIAVYLVRARESDV